MYCKTNKLTACQQSPVGGVEVHGRHFGYFRVALHFDLVGSELHVFHAGDNVPNHDATVPARTNHLPKTTSRDHDATVPARANHLPKTTSRDHDATVPVRTNHLPNTTSEDHTATVLLRTHHRRLSTAAARLTRLKSGLKSAAVTGPLCVYSCVSRSSSAGSKIPINDVVNKNAYNRKIMNTSLGRQDNAKI